MFKKVINKLKKMSTNKSNVRKKLVSKNKTKNTVNKKIFTGDKDQEETTSSTNYPNGISVKTKKLKIEIEDLQEKEKKQKILILQEKTAELEQQLNNLKTQYETEKNENLEIIKNKNIELNKKIEECQKVTKENKKLVIKLKGLEGELNEKYNKFINQNLYKKIKTNIKTEKNIQKDINVAEKEIENVKKMAEVYKKEKQKYENLMNDQLESNKINDLNEINKEINQLISENEKLKLIKLEHSKCKKNILDLTSKLNIANNELEFETKKKDMIMSATVNKDTKGNEENEILNDLNNISEDAIYAGEKNELVENKVNYSKKIRKKILKKGIPRIQPISNSSYKYIQTEFNSISKKNINKKKLIGNLKEVTSLIDNVYVPESNLFTERESDVLRKILPEEVLNDYKEKFEKKKLEKEKVEELIEENEIKEPKEQIKKNNEQIVYDIDLNKMKKKTEEMKKTELKMKSINNKKNINELQRKINELQKQINEKNKIINRMNKNIGNFSKIIEEMKKKNKL